MMCDKCGKNNSRQFYGSDTNFKWLCVICYPLGKINTWSTVEKIKSRVRMKDGKILYGRQGERERDRRLKLQENNKKYGNSNYMSN